MARKEGFIDNLDDELKSKTDNAEDDSFTQWYNKELRVSKDEIPIVLIELNDAAYNYLKKEHYEKALTLLQKSHGILEVIDIDQNPRDRNLALITFQNMSMWYQRLGMLEECAAWLTSCLGYIPTASSENTIPERMSNVSYECKLRMQLCAIMSQIHKHKDAQKQAILSVKLIHQLFKDLNDLWIYVCKRVQVESDELKDIKNKIKNNLMDFDTATLNGLNEESMSIQEKLAIKLLPIVEEVLKHMIKEKQDYNFNEEVEVKDQADMRNILGFLNQNEWVYNLNIGNIMQIESVSNSDLMNAKTMEYELTRESFLDKITLLCVAYFCTSTEIRFILQLREDESLEDPEEVKKRETESEYWHAKSLEVACIFLPSECPLLNHIMLSYQKHHSPTQYTIPEESEYTDNLMVVKPLKGIQTCKYNPVIRITPKPDPILTPHNLSPLRKMTEDIFWKINENEIKTIVTQSQKHTGQNSVVNLKDQSSIFRRSSNISSVRLPEDAFDNDYDDSAMVDPKVKQSNDQVVPRPEIEEEKLAPREFRRTNAIQPRQPASVNNPDHMSRQVRNIDVAVNTDKHEFHDTAREVKFQGKF